MTHESDDLIGRLKYRVGNPSAWDYYDDGASEMMREAFTALAEKVVRIAELIAQVDQYCNLLATSDDALTASRAECEGLRAALDLDAAISRAAITWCGEKDRETSLGDIHYFKGNWSALPGLTAYVDRELGRSARAALSRKETGDAA